MAFGWSRWNAACQNAQNIIIVGTEHIDNYGPVDEVTSAPRGDIPLPYPIIKGDLLGALESLLNEPKASLPNDDR